MSLGQRDRDWLDWPFFEPSHRALAETLDRWIEGGGLAGVNHADTDATCVEFVRRLGAAGFVRHAVPAPYGVAAPIDSRSLCIIRETLAYHDGLADFAFAMQGLGAGPIGLDGSESLCRSVLPRVVGGDIVPAFALSEPETGSDVAALACTAQADGDSYLLDGHKMWVSNGGIADLYCVFARTGEAPGARGISAFAVDAATPGLVVAERIEVMAPHPLARLRFDSCRVPADRRLGQPGQGFKLAMRTLDIFRPSVAAAATGFARRALDEALGQAQARPMFGGRLADLQLTQAKLGEMATLIDASALLTYRAAWRRDVQRLPTTQVAAMAKMAATENAQIVIDAALQLFGGRGVRRGEVVERLYREIRALRIYEGATEVQKLIIARGLLEGSARAPAAARP